MSTADANAVPSVLFPMLLRNGSRYRSLRRHNFSSEEKMWICKNLVDSCDELDNDLIDQIKSFCLRYDLSSKIIVNWLDNIAGMSFQLIHNFLSNLDCLFIVSPL